MDIETKRAIGLRVREKREAAGFTREKLGELSGLSPRFIANIEFGDAAFSLDSLMKVCGVLGCSSDALLFGSDTASPWDDIAARLQQLDPRYTPQVSALLQAFYDAVMLKDE